MKKLNKKGFTLVELLAVIVVLAIIMVLTIPSVLSSLTTARQSAFLTYAKKMLNAAQEKYQSNQLVGIDGKCFTVESLSDDTTSQYHGIVSISTETDANGNTKPVARIKMYDTSYQLGITENTSLGDQKDGVTYSEIETINGNLKSGALQENNLSDTVKNGIKCS